LSENQPPVPDFFFYSIGLLFLIIAIAFFLIPVLSRSGAFAGLKIPWIILYTYNRDGFYFATSPLLIIISVIGLLLFLLRR
jgi:hypothetical protein